MKHSLKFFAVAALIMSTVFCSPENPDQKERITIKSYTETVTLPYGVPTLIHFTIEGVSKNLSVRIGRLPDEINITNEEYDTHGGVIELTSYLDEDSSFFIELVASGDMSSDTKIIVINTVKKDAPFTISAEKTQIEFRYGTKDTVRYTAINPKGLVSASLDNLPEGITAEQDYNPETKTGNIFFITSAKLENKTETLIRFSDTKSDTELKIVFATDWEAPLLEPEVILESNVIYPYETELVKEIPFSVPGEAQVDEIYVTAGNGLNPSIEPADDKRSGIIKVWATQTLQDSDIVTLVAKSGDKEAKTSFTLEKAYISPDYERIQVSNKGTESGYNVTVSANLLVSIIIPDDKPFVHCTVQGNRIHIDVDENTTMGYRYATISVTEPLGFLNKNIEIVQAPAGGSTETDKQALIAIYHALNIKDWIEYGAFGDYYSNWNTDAYLDMWLGTGWTGEPSSWSGHEVTGRCWYIHLIGEQPSSSGYIPEELGDLTKLVEFEMFPKFKITHLPESIKNLVNLKELELSDNIIDYDISQWTGLHELMNNPEHKLRFINFCHTGLHGTLPEWVKDITPEGGYFGIMGCHFSGQVPDSVADSDYWNDEEWIRVEEFEGNARFDASKYEMTGDKWSYIMTHGEAAILTQADNYALWVGERPENTKWVDDKFGGHWEWTD